MPVKLIGHEIFQEEAKNDNDSIGQLDGDANFLEQQQFFELSQIFEEAYKYQSTR